MNIIANIISEKKRTILYSCLSVGLQLASVQLADPQVYSPSDKMIL